MSDQHGIAGQSDDGNERHNSADRFWRWFDANADGYRALTDYLSTAFGAPFALTHTGGGCLAIEALTFEGGLGVMITDAEDVLATWHERIHSDHNLGYAVGVYRAYDETYIHKGETHTQRTLECDPIAFVIDHDADMPDDVVALVARGLSEASKITS